MGMEATPEVGEDRLTVSRKAEGLVPDGFPVRRFFEGYL
jgi:hypothetical protein